MPSGKTHERINGWFIHSLIFISLHILSYLQFGVLGLLSSFLFVAGYIIGTYYLGPDLDIKSRPFYRWGILRFIWKPYQKLFHHRSFWTHSLIISDVIRWAYLLLWLLPMLLVLYVTSRELWDMLQQSAANFLNARWWEMSCFLLGISTASALHIIADYIGSSVKRRKQKKKRSR